MTIPNYITLLRILLVPFFFISLLSYETRGKEYLSLALLLFVIASISDGLDGFLARLLNQKSKLGEILDPIADKLLITTGFLGLLFLDSLPIQPPLWVTVTIVFREMILIIGTLVVFLMTGLLYAEPNFTGKLTTTVQMLTLISVMLQLKITLPLCILTFVITVISGSIYCKRGLIHLNKSL